MAARVLAAVAAHALAGRARSPIQLWGGTYERKNDRSRSRDRRRSRSRDRRDRSRSRSPEKPVKKKSGWDVPTEEVQTGATVGMPIMAPQVLNETRQARRVYIGNLPGSVPPQEVVDFFNDAMIKAGLNKWAGPPIVQAVHQSQEGGFVFIELRDVDDPDEEGRTPIKKLRTPDDVTEEDEEAK